MSQLSEFEGKENIKTDNINHKAEDVKSSNYDKIIWIDLM